MNVAVQKPESPVALAHSVLANRNRHHFCVDIRLLKGLFVKGSPERVFLLGARLCGLTVLTLLLLRVAARWLWVLPAIEPSPPLWQMRLSSVVQILLYAGMLSNLCVGCTHAKQWKGTCFSASIASPG